jgi:hypothetical protein
MIAGRVVAADAEELHRIVADPVCQWRIVSGVPAALRPRARTDSCSNTRMVSVRVGLWGRDVLWVCWLLVPGRGTTEVGLVARFESRLLLGRVLARVGVRGWITRRLEVTLGALAELAYRAVEDLDDIEREADFTEPNAGATGGYGPATRRREP